jgi:hypothetical protein
MDQVLEVMGVGNLGIKELPPCGVNVEGHTLFNPII